MANSYETISDTLLVAAIDFGTTFSGYAFAFKSDYKEDPLKISGFTWTLGSQAGLSLKTPTCVLFNPRGEFDSFGAEAEEKYTALAESEDHQSWYFFSRFKMQLYKNHEIPRNLTIEDDQGKHLEAIKVISKSINYLRGHLMEQIVKRDIQIKKTEITWVLTVPAIWSDPAKQFMREAAVEGGIPNSQLMLALEPEAASIYCKHLPTERLDSGGKSALGAFSPGTKYLILDAGGGTVDITVQEVQTDGSIKQLYMANGGDWGGTKVDQAFDEYMMELAGPATVYKFRDEDKAGHLDLCREFEIKKRNIQPDQTSKVTFRVPSTLSEIFKREEGTDFKQSVSSSKRVTWVGDKLRVDAALAQGFFDSTCQHIVQHLKGIFKEEKVRGTDTILMVGGFSDSPMLRKAVEVSFPDKNIIIPHEAGLAVLKGAVQYGYEPRIISTRVCKFTYGVRTNSRFKEGVDPESKRKMVEGKARCKDSFSKHVEIEQAVHINEATEEKMYYPLHSKQTSMLISIYTSTDKKPRYTDDPSCAYLGELTVQMPDTRRGKDREVSVQLTFGGTEIEVKATNTGTGEETKAILNFLR
ncbi:heat shock 70 kDa protein 12B-like [Mytilus trossulus]|uniref:heat shock 70 kDa protein 12B-like n=1 Tax=Mytilus trossulus TaxID=6551 RepID=UPI00300448F7